MGNTVRQTRLPCSSEKQAPTLACNCLTCYEELKKVYTDVEIIDVLQLFEEALDADTFIGVKNNDKEPRDLHTVAL